MNNLPKVIGITGLKRSGKDTIGGIFVKKYNYTRLAFADPLKNIVKIMFNFNNEQLNGDLKEVEDEYWNVTPRKTMQFMGDILRTHMNELIPDINANYFVTILEINCMNPFEMCQTRIRYLFTSRKINFMNPF